MGCAEHPMKGWPSSQVKQWVVQGAFWRGEDVLFQHLQQHKHPIHQAQDGEYQRETYVLPALLLSMYGFYSLFGKL